MHFHFIMMKQHSPPPSSLSPEAANTTETSSGSKSRRPRRNSRQHPVKNENGVAATTTTTTHRARNWNLLRKPRRSAASTMMTENSLLEKELSFMEILKIFWRLHPKEWMILTVSLVQRHFYWPLLARIRSSKEQTHDDFSRSPMLLICTAGTISLVVASLMASSSFRCLLQQTLYLALFVLYCQIAWIALKWIVYIYDDPAIHRGVVFAKGWLQLVVRRGTRALQNQDSAAFIMAVSTLKAAPIGVNFIRYAIRYRMRNLNLVWMDDISRRHVLFVRHSSAMPSFQQRLQEKIAASLHPTLHHLRSWSDSVSNTSPRDDEHHGTLS